MRNSTLLFLARETDGKVSHICLAMKKRSFGKGRWNGVGGKVMEGETIIDAMRRETKEEIAVSVSDVSKVAELTFTFPSNQAWDQVVHVYTARTWEGEPTESEEMAPAWFALADIPYTNMWPDDIFWLPLVLQGLLVRAQFTFGENDVILEKNVAIVGEL